MLVRTPSCGRPTLLRRLRCSVSRLDAFRGTIPPRRIRSESGSRTTSPNWSASRDELNWQSPRRVTSHRAKPRSARSNLIIQQGSRSDARDWCWHFWRFYVRSNPVVRSRSQTEEIADLLGGLGDSIESNPSMALTLFPVDLVGGAVRGIHFEQKGTKITKSGGRGAMGSHQVGGVGYRRAMRPR